MVHTQELQGSQSDESLAIKRFFKLQFQFWKWNIKWTPEGLGQKQWIVTSRPPLSWVWNIVLKLTKSFSVSLSLSLSLSLSPHLDELPVTTDPNDTEKADMRIVQAAAQEVLNNINVSIF